MAERTVPKISVVMPSYNAEKFVDSTLTTLLGQTYKDWEAFIVDGGSTDSTLAKLDAYAEQHPNLRIVREKCQSPYDAIYKGIRMTRGEFVYILCFSDGYLNDRWYEKCMAAMEADPELSIVWGIPFDLFDDPEHQGKKMNPHFVYAHFLNDASKYERSSVVKRILAKIDLRHPSSLLRFFKKINKTNVSAVRNLMKREAPPAKQEWFKYWLKNGTIFPDGNMCVARKVLLECLKPYQGGDDVGNWDDFFFDFNRKGYLSLCIPEPANYGRISPPGKGQVTQRFSAKIDKDRLEYFERVKKFRNDLENHRETVVFRDRTGKVIP